MYDTLYVYVSTVYDGRTRLVEEAARNIDVLGSLDVYSASAVHTPVARRRDLRDKRQATCE